jgi:hypothetical protein
MLEVADVYQTPIPLIKHMLATHAGNEFEGLVRKMYSEESTSGQGSYARLSVWPNLLHSSSAK